MSQVELKEAQAHLPELLERAASGEEIVIVRDHEPLAQIVSLQERRHRHFGSAKGEIEIHEDFDEPLEDFEDYT